MSDPGTVERWTLYVAEDNGSLPAVWPGVDSRPWRGHRRVVVVPEANLTACALGAAGRASDLRRPEGAVARRLAR